VLDLGALGDLGEDVPGGRGRLLLLEGHAQLFGLEEALCDQDLAQGGMAVRLDREGLDQLIEAQAAPGHQEVPEVRGPVVGVQRPGDRVLVEHAHQAEHLAEVQERSLLQLLDRRLELTPGDQTAVQEVAAELQGFSNGQGGQRHGDLLPERGQRLS